MGASIRTAILTLIFILPATGTVGEEEGGSTTFDPKTAIARTSALLKDVLDKHWIVTVEHHSIEVRSKFDVYHVTKISRGSMLPEFSDSTSIRELQKETNPTTYVIRLRFEKPLSPEEFELRRRERNKVANIVGFGASSKSEWVEALENYQKIKVPRYRMGFYDVYRETSDHPARQIYPPVAVARIGGAKELIDTVFRKPRTWAD